MKRLLMALAITALGLAYSGTAGAFTQTTTGTMNIGGSVLASCTVTTLPMDFGVMSTSAITESTSTITVNCSTGTAYRVDIDGGQNMFAGSMTRYIKTGTAPADSTNTTGYYLYKTSAKLTSDEWGDNKATFCTTCPFPFPTGLGGIGSGADQLLTVYGTTSPATNGNGTYSDVVTVTVNY